MTRPATVMVLATVLVATGGYCHFVMAEETLLEDSFQFFDLGETWQEHGAGVPDVMLDVGSDAGSDVLQMATSGFDDDFYGIETITPIPVAGLADLKVDARLRPVNQGVEGSVAAAEVALIGDSGLVLRAFASNNAGPDPESANDWADHYEDNEGNTATSGPWPHCTDQGGPACDAMRNLVLTLTDAETTVQAFDDNSELDGFPRWETTIDDITIADLGNSVTIALRQLAVDGGDDVMGFFDHILVTTSGAATTLLQAGDADQDLDFDQIDLVQVQIAAKYLTGQPATWGEGDWDGAPGGTPGSPPQGDGLFDQRDIIAALATNHYLKGPYAAIRSGGKADDEQTSLVYNLATGELGVNAPASTELTSINIDSAAGVFTGDPAANLGGSFDNDGDGNLFKATFGNSFGSFSFGNVAQTGLTEAFLTSDLTVVGSLAGGGDLGNVDLIYVPEPATSMLLGIGLLAVVSQCRKRPSTASMVE